MPEAAGLSREAAHSGIRGCEPCQWLHPAVPAVLGQNGWCIGQEEILLSAGEAIARSVKPKVRHGDKTLSVSYLQKI